MSSSNASPTGRAAPRLRMTDRAGRGGGLRAGLPDVKGVTANTGGFQGTLEVSMSAKTPTAGGEVSWIQRQEDHTLWLFHHSSPPSPPRSEGRGTGDEWWKSQPSTSKPCHYTGLDVNQEG
ncbi:unnamed protein product [Arctogadus glacialis]